MSSFINNGVRKTTLNKKKLGKILEPSHDGKSFSLLATGRELGILDEGIFDMFGQFVAETFTDEKGWEAVSHEHHTLFKQKDSDSKEAFLRPIGHNFDKGGEANVWDVVLNDVMKDLFINYIQLRKLFLTSKQQ